MMNSLSLDLAGLWDGVISAPATIRRLLTTPGWRSLLSRSEQVRDHDEQARLDRLDLSGIEWRWSVPPFHTSHRLFSPTRRAGRGRGSSAPRAEDGPHGITTIGRPNSSDYWVTGRYQPVLLLMLFAPSSPCD